MARPKTPPDMNEAEPVEAMPEALPEPAPEPAPPPLAADDGRKTPKEWSLVRGHFNAKPKGTIRPGAKTMRAWIYDSTKVHAGWGKRVAADVRLTGDQYDAAVDAALNVSLG